MTGAYTKVLLSADGEAPPATDQSRANQPWSRWLRSRMTWNGSSQETPVRSAPATAIETPATTTPQLTHSTVRGGRGVADRASTAAGRAGPRSRWPRSAAGSRADLGAAVVTSTPGGS